ILKFEGKFPGCAQIFLEQNYRSSGNILAAANAVIARNPGRKPKSLWTDRGRGPRLRLVAAPEDEAEARYVMDEIIRVSYEEKIPLREIAVLYRTNAQARPFEEALRLGGVRYRVVGGTSLFDRKEVRDLVAYLRAALNPRDEVALLRIVTVPARGIGDQTVARAAADRVGAARRTTRGGGYRGQRAVRGRSFRLPRPNHARLSGSGRGHLGCSHPDDAPRRQGPGMALRLPLRDGGGSSTPFRAGVRRLRFRAARGRRAGPRGGTAALLRGHDPRAGAADPHSRHGAHEARQARSAHPVALPGGHSRRAARDDRPARPAAGRPEGSAASQSAQLLRLDER